MSGSEVFWMLVFVGLVLTAGGVAVGFMAEPPGGFRWLHAVVMIGLIDAAIVYMMGVAALVRGWTR